MNQSRYYITTSIPYVNARPHLGFALEAVQADALARYHRLQGDDVRFLTGTDDNALKNVQAAEAAGLPVRQLVDRNAQAFEALRDPLALSYDDFIRTSVDPRHEAGVRKLWRATVRAGDVYKRAYRGLYCVRCEQFYAEDELVNGLCPIHHVAPELVEEENYFFRLSRYAGALKALVERQQLRILPEHRRNEVLSFIRRGLQDFSISRSASRARGWGIPVPDDPSQVMYVWFDALGNYITALGYATDGQLYRRYWVDNPHRVHVIGKDILRFHAVYWPAMLLSAGEPLPTTIDVHEFLNLAGERMSKSRSHGADPVALADAYGTDALRYWLLREMPRTEDTDFTVERMVRRANDDLANDLGNLLNRTVGMLDRYRDGTVLAPGPEQPADAELKALAARIPEETRIALDDFDFRAALDSIWRLVTRANRYVEENTPWVLARQAREGDDAAARRLDTVLYNLAESLRLLAYHLAPYIPASAERIMDQLTAGAEDTDRFATDAQGWGRLVPGSRVARRRPIFPRIELTAGDVGREDVKHMDEQATYEALTRIAASTGERTGWDFSRMHATREPVPWDYLELVPHYLKLADIILDIGTGGGEKLLTFAPRVAQAVGVDPDPAMIQTARANAGGQTNVSFMEMGAETLAFPDATFDVVLTRHAPVVVSEVARVLKPGGYFITQQVGARNMANIRQAFATGSGTRYEEEERARIDEFARRGGRIVATGAYDVRYWVEDIPSLVFWLQAIAGANEVPADFAMERDWRAVNRIITTWSTPRGVLTNEHRTLLIVQNSDGFTPSGT